MIVEGDTVASGAVGELPTPPAGLHLSRVTMVDERPGGWSGGFPGCVWMYYVDDGELHLRADQPLRVIHKLKVQGEEYRPPTGRDVEAGAETVLTAGESVVLDGSTKWWYWTEGGIPTRLLVVAVTEHPYTAADLR